MDQQEINTVVLYMLMGYLVMIFSKIAENNVRITYNKAGLRLKKYNLYGKIFYFILFIILLIFSVFRDVGKDTGGNDVMTYISMFEYAGNVEFDWFKIFTMNQNEPLFSYLNFVVQQISNNYIIYFMIVYGFITFCFLYFISVFYEKKWYFASIILYWPIYIYFFSALRSGLAISLTILSLIYFYKKRNVLGTGLAVMSFFFHFAAIFYILYLLFYYFSKKFMRSKFKMIILIISMYIIVFFSYSFIKNILYDTRYAFLTFVDSSLLGSLPMLFIAILCLIFYKELKNNYSDKMLVINSVFFNCIMIPITYGMGIYRLPHFFMLSSSVSLACVVIIIENKLLKSGNGKLLFNYVYFILLSIYTFYKLYSICSQAGLLNYSNIIFTMMF